MFDPSPLNIKHYCAIMDDSVNMHFEEALIANNLTSEKEVNKLCDEYNSLSSDEKPPGYLNNVLMLPIPGVLLKKSVKEVLCLRSIFLR